MWGVVWLEIAVVLGMYVRAEYRALCLRAVFFEARVGQCDGLSKPEGLTC